MSRALYKNSNTQGGKQYFHGTKNTGKNSGRLPFAQFFSCNHLETHGSRQRNTKYMKEQVKKLYQEMQEDIDLYQEMGIPAINRLSGALKSIKGIVLRLKTTVLQDGFKDETQEIDFFKHQKPLFVSEQIYLIEYATIFLGKPSQSEGLPEAYYQEELKRLQLFINRFGFLYQCYKMEASDLDHILFLRDAGPTGMLLPDMADADPAFATNGDYLWAKFMAYERLQLWLEEELKCLRGGPAAPASGDHAPAGIPGGLKWTGETINLVEFAYGIWLTGQVNNGQVSITEIVEFLEHAFRVRIGKPHRRWQGIANRKRLGYTKFLDEMKAGIERRIEEEISK
jgi:hypothetical protein